MLFTENINRIVSSHAGQLYFSQAKAVLRGEPGLFRMGTNKKRMKRLMEELWHLDAEEISFLENIKPVVDILAILGEKHNQIRYHLGQNLTLKYTPQLRFYYDNTIEQAERINHLIEKIYKND